MGEAVGKKVFKRHLDVFLKPLFDTLSRVTTSQLARHAAASCVRQLSSFVGPSIFRGRLTDSQREVTSFLHCSCHCRVCLCYYIRNSGETDDRHGAGSIRWKPAPLAVDCVNLAQHDQCVWHAVRPRARRRELESTSSPLASDRSLHLKVACFSQPILVSSGSSPHLCGDNIRCLTRVTCTPSRLWTPKCRLVHPPRHLPDSWA